MKFLCYTWMFMLLVFCAASKCWKRGRIKRCNCRTLLTNVNTLMNKKMGAFRESLLQTTLPLSKDARITLLEQKLRDIKTELISVKRNVHIQAVFRKSTRKTLLLHSGALRNASRSLTNMEVQHRNMTNIIMDLKRAYMYNARNVLSDIKSKSKSNPRLSIQPYPKDCDEVFVNGGLRYKGEYYIYIQPSSSTKAFKVLCQNSNNSGWIVFQSRKHGDMDFRRTWNEYKDGFGKLTNDFWLGNDRLHQVTSNRNSILRIEMGDWLGNHYYAEYQNFTVGNENNLYRLHVSGYSGTAGDSLSAKWRSHNNQPFSTHDRDNDKRHYDNCAKHYPGAWWFTDCFDSHLNGKFYKKQQHQNYFSRDGIHWKSIHPYSSLKYSIMMTRQHRRNDSKISEKQTNTNFVVL